MQHGLYRKTNKGMCNGCDHPAYAPSKNINPKNACKKCRKQITNGKNKNKSYKDYDNF